MSWKFWNRANKQPEIQGNDKAAAESAARNAQLADWFGFPGSGKELIAMQRLVGNQTVLKLLAAPQINSSKKELQIKNGVNAKKRFLFLRSLAGKRQKKS
jgi:hypothetical protein